MSTLKEDAAQLLVRGVSETDTAKQLGVTTSYISQIKQDSEFQSIYNKLVTANKITKLPLYTQIDNNYDFLEARLAETFAQNSDIILAAIIQKPETMLKAMTTLNSLKRRGQGETTEVPDTVVLMLPEFMTSTCIPEVKHNSNNEVIEVDGRVLVTRESGAMQQQLQAEAKLLDIKPVTMPKLQLGDEPLDLENL